MRIPGVLGAATAATLLCTTPFPAQATRVAYQVPCPEELDRSEPLDVVAPDGSPSQMFVPAHLCTVDGEVMELIADIDLEGGLIADAVFRTLDEDELAAAAAADVGDNVAGSSGEEEQAGEAGEEEQVEQQESDGAGEVESGASSAAHCVAGCASECNSLRAPRAEICECISQCDTSGCDDSAKVVIGTYVESGCPNAPDSSEQEEASEAEAGEAEAGGDAGEDQGVASNQTDATEPRRWGSGGSGKVEARAEREEPIEPAEAWTLESAQQFLGLWEGDIVSQDGEERVEGVRYNFTEIGLVYIKIPLRNEANLPGIRMRYVPSWGPEPHELLLTHIEPEYTHLPQQPCLFEFMGVDLLAIQFPRMTTVQAPNGDVVAGPLVQAEEMGGDGHKERVALRRVQGTGYGEDDDGAFAHEEL